jgi:hypothetical protein
VAPLPVGACHCSVHCVLTEVQPAVNPAGAAVIAFTGTAAGPVTLLAIPAIENATPSPVTARLPLVPVNTALATTALATVAVTR